MQPGLDDGEVVAGCKEEVGVGVTQVMDAKTLRVFDAGFLQSFAQDAQSGFAADGSVGFCRQKADGGAPDRTEDVVIVRRRPAFVALEVVDDGGGAVGGEDIILLFGAFAAPGVDVCARLAAMGAKIDPLHAQQFGGAPAGMQITAEKGVCACAGEGAGVFFEMGEQAVIFGEGEGAGGGVGGGAGAEDVGLAGVFDVYAFTLNEGVEGGNACKSVVDGVFGEACAAQFFLPLANMGFGSPKQVDAVNVGEEGSPAAKGEAISALGVGAVGFAAFELEPGLDERFCANVGRGR